MPSLNHAPTREPTADLLKGIAVLLMIQVHIVQLFARQDVMTSEVGRVLMFLGGPPVAPVFLAVFGYYALRPELSTGRLIKRAGKLLLLGLLLNMGLNAHLLFRIYSGELVLNPWAYILGVDVLFAAGLSLIVMALLRPALKERAWLWASMSVLVTAATPWLGQFLTTDSSWTWLAAYVAGNQAWSYFPLFPWLAYALLGVAASHLPRHMPAWSYRLATVFALLGLTFTAEFAFEIANDLPRYYHHDLRFFAWMCLFMLVWVPLCRTLAQRRGEAHWISWFGQRVTAVYVLQWLLIGNIATAIYKTESLLHCALWVVTLVVLTVAIIRKYEQLHLQWQRK